LLGAKRSLNVHEYAGMEIFKSFGIPVPKTRSATTVEEAEQIYKDEFGVGNDCVIKAMVLTGGRGLGHFTSGLQGGVHICRSVEDVAKYSRKMLGFNLITKQTTSDGLPCNRIMLAERMYLRREMYISIMLDRAAGGAMFVVSPHGGTSIEDVAATTPEAIYKQPIDVASGVTAQQAKFLAKALGFREHTPAFEECQATIYKLYDMFVKRDCLLLEINPFAETPDGKVMICDGKIDFDNNSQFRQEEVFRYRDRSQEDSREVEVRPRTRLSATLTLPTPSGSKI
jgi:succinyl-CoA synthetase beta subunit